MNSLPFEIEKFKRWASIEPAPRYGEWECDYDNWPELYAATLGFIQSSNSECWSEHDVNDILYVIARDNEDAYLVEELSSMPDRLLFLATAAVSSKENDAKWQFARQLGELTKHKADAERLLLLLIEDHDEYVSRISLLALAALRSPHTEQLAIRAWSSGQEYQRIAALWALKNIESPKLPEYLQLARADGRNTVVSNAEEIQSVKMADDDKNLDSE